MGWYQQRSFWVWGNVPFLQLAGTMQMYSLRICEYFCHARHLRWVHFFLYVSYISIKLFLKIIQIFVTFHFLVLPQLSKVSHGIFWLVCLRASPRQNSYLQIFVNLLLIFLDLNSEEIKIIVKEILVFLCHCSAQCLELRKQAMNAWCVNERMN